MNENCRFLKKHTEFLIKEIGIETASKLAGRSATSVTRYYSDLAVNDARYITIETVSEIEAIATYPFVTAALAELNGHSVICPGFHRGRLRGTSDIVIALAHKFSMLIDEYYATANDGLITQNKSKKLLLLVVSMQALLVDLKFELDQSTSPSPN